MAVTLKSITEDNFSLLYTYPSPRDRTRPRMPSSASKKKEMADGTIENSANIQL